MRPDEERLRELHLRVEATIAQHGWAVQGVFPTDDDPGVEFAYTVGLERRGMPELLMVGLPSRLAGVLLNDAAQQMLDRGRAYEPGERVSEVLRDFDVLVVEVADTREHMTMANVHAQGVYGNERVAGLQLLWPDKHGRFPGEPGYDPSLPDQRP